MLILLILMAISSVLIGTVIQSHTQMIREEQHLQAALLAEAGLRRGIAQLRNDSAFRTETWQVPAEPTAGLDVATVNIVVSEASDAQGQRTVSATAEYPVGIPNSIRITRELPIPAADQ